MQAGICTRGHEAHRIVLDGQCARVRHSTIAHGTRRRGRRQRDWRASDRRGVVCAARAGRCAELCAAAFNADSGRRFGGPGNRPRGRPAAFPAATAATTSRIAALHRWGVVRRADRRRDRLRVAAALARGGPTAGAREPQHRRGGGCGSGVRVGGARGRTVATGLRQRFAWPATGSCGAELGASASSA